MYFERQPGVVLSPFVEKLWCCEGYQARHQRERVLPNARFQLIIELTAQHGPAIVVGIRTKHSILETASIRSVVGVVFRAGAAQSFFAAPADAFLSCAVPLDDLWSSGSGELCGRLREATSLASRLQILESELQRRLKRAKELHGAVRYALGAFSGDPHISRVGEVARSAGLSRRHFTDMFRTQVGLAPKLYCRLLRFQQVVRRIASGLPVDWAEVSLDGGYYDQAHMAHEFREFSGVSPGAWLASERPFLNHAVAD